MATTKKWYVEVDAQTNEVVARDLPTENAHIGVLCQDGKKRDLWECNYQYISKLLQNERTSRLEFKVFYREGSNGPVKRWPFTKRRRAVYPIVRRAKKRAAAKAQYQA